MKKKTNYFKWNLFFCLPSLAGPYIFLSSFGGMSELSAIIISMFFYLYDIRNSNKVDEFEDRIKELEKNQKS